MEKGHHHLRSHRPNQNNLRHYSTSLLHLRLVSNGSHHLYLMHHYPLIRLSHNQTHQLLLVQGPRYYLYSCLWLELRFTLAHVIHLFPHGRSLAGYNLDQTNPLPLLHGSDHPHCCIRLAAHLCLLFELVTILSSHYWCHLIPPDHSHHYTHSMHLLLLQQPATEHYLQFTQNFLPLLQYQHCPPHIFQVELQSASCFVLL